MFRQDQFRQVDALYLGRLKTAHLGTKFDI